MAGRSRSLGFRAALAAVFLVGFFVFAIAIAAALVLLGVEILKLLPEVRGGTLVSLVLFGGLACFAAAAMILWSAAPRIDRFEPPGPELQPDAVPELFREIEA